jgi:hypothetical protein
LAASAATLATTPPDGTGIGDGIDDAPGNDDDSGSDNAHDPS